MDCEQPGGTNDFGLTIGQGILMFGNGPNDFTIRSSSTYNNNVWTNVTATRASSTGAMVLYVNGSQVAAGTGNTGTLTASTFMFIAEGFNDVYYSGSIAVCQAYRSVLTSTQVTSLFNAYKARYGIL